MKCPIQRFQHVLQIIFLKARVHGKAYVVLADVVCTREPVLGYATAAARPAVALYLGTRSASFAAICVALPDGFIVTKVGVDLAGAD